MPFLVLYVCTGNVCRSPSAELLMRAGADPDVVLVASAGVAALEGHPVDGPTARALTELGVDPGGHRARQFEPWMAERADLVLTAERAHRDRVMVDAPSAFRRTFTMREFARLAPSARGADPDEVVAGAAQARAVGDPRSLEDDDVPDPFGDRGDRARDVVALIATTVRVTVDALGAGVRPAPARRPSPAPRPRPAAVASRPAPVASRPRPAARPRPGRF